MLLPLLPFYRHLIVIILLPLHLLWLSPLLLSLLPPPNPYDHKNQTYASWFATEEEGQLVVAAAFCCRSVGLHTGVFNLDMMMTSTGPRLLEINPRMGGFYLYHWIRHLYDVDLVHVAIMVACGVRPVAVNRSYVN